MAILLIQDQADVRERLAFAVESTFSGDVYQTGTLAEARKLIQSPPNSEVTLVVLDLKPELIAKQSELDLLQSANPKLECVVCSDTMLPGVKLKWTVLSVVVRKDFLNNLLATLQKLSDDKRIQLGFQEADFCKIKTKLLLSVCPLRGDIYIRLNEVKFIKLFREGDNFDAEDMEKYTVKKGIAYLYLRKTQVQEFIQKYNQELQKLLQAQAPQSMSLEELGKMHDSIYETASELGRRVGFTKEIQQMAKAHMQLTIKSMEKSPKLGNILSRIKAYKGLYLGAHSGIVGYLACAIATQMDWASDSTFQKLTLAAFLHDVVLTNHDLAKCGTVKEATDHGFSEAEIAAFKTHPQKGAEIARAFQEVPPDVDAIIIQHHERPDGSGFPRGIGYSYISPLSMVFIVAHDMAQHFLENDSNLDRDAFLVKAREKYTSSQFRKVLEAIEKL
jgi:HD-GYP domain-containing protein (c-di-GMP phosphodiesterase class II)